MMVKETARARGNWEGLCMALRDGRGHAADYSAADRRRAEGIHAFQPPPNSLPACLLHNCLFQALLTCAARAAWSGLWRSEQRCRQPE
jgi:hypothetical protein